MEELKLNDIADELLILNKITIDKLFQLENCADCVALYVFYYKTAKWQKTNTIKANDVYIRKSLKWGIDKIRKTKKTLKEHGLINIVQRRKDGKINGWYIEVSYLVAQKKIEEINVKVEENNNTQEQQLPNPTSGSEEINALKEEIKYLKKENEMLKNNKYIYTKESEDIFVKEFEELWSSYPNKQGKANALKSYIKLRDKGKVNFDVVKEGLQIYLIYCKQNENWYRPKNGSTWFNQECWRDELPIKKEETKKEVTDIDFLDLFKEEE